MSDILLIDDMPGVRRAISAMLTSSGHTVVAAMSAAQGLDLLKQRRFDLVITDMLMPAINGAAVLSTLREMPDRPRVIAISGGGAGTSAATALRVAQPLADGYLEKPFEKADLCAVIRRVLGDI